jgi:hypothetical protein
MFIGICVFIINRRQKSKTPFEAWAEHYDKNARRPDTPINNQQNEDIHHFYKKSPRLSISQNTAFTPYVSGRIPQRNSIIGHQTNSPERRSIQFRNTQPKFEL